MTHTKGRAIRARAKRSQRATHTHTPPTPAAFIAAVPDTAGTRLVVRSFASPITILDGAAITIQRVRQHPGRVAVLATERDACAVPRP